MNEQAVLSARAGNLHVCPLYPHPICKPRRRRTVRSWTGVVAILLLAACVSGIACSTGQFIKEGEQEFTLLLAAGDRLACCGVVLLRDQRYVVFGRADYINRLSWAWVGFLSAQGSQLWANELPVPSKNSGLIRGASSPSGEIFGVGHTTESSGRQAALVVNIKPDGAIAWTKSFVVGDDTWATAVTASRPATIIVVGIGRESGNQRTVIATNLTPHGDLVWQRVLLRGPDLEVNGVQDVATDGYVVFGSFGLPRFDLSGTLQWQNAFGEVLAVVEMPNRDLVAVTTPQAETATFQLMRLTADGQLVRRKAVLLEGACGGIAGLWVSARGRIVAAGTRCQRPEQLWVAEFAEQGVPVGSISKFSLPAGASAFHVGPVDDVGIVAAGMFVEGSPNRGKGWLFRGGLKN